MKKEFIMVNGKKLSQLWVNMLCLLLCDVKVKNLYLALKMNKGTVKTHWQRLHERLQLHTVQEFINWSTPAKIKRKLMSHCTLDLASIRENYSH